MSWADIRKVSDAGIAKDYWAVGDAKGLQINGTVSATSINQKVYAFILGFDHNSGREGTNTLVSLDVAEITPSPARVTVTVSDNLSVFNVTSVLFKDKLPAALPIVQLTSFAVVESSLQQ